MLKEFSKGAATQFTLSKAGSEAPILQETIAALNDSLLGENASIRFVSVGFQLNLLN